ncbi:MAG: B12-binding domain-containing radical SAM protein [Planctomycetota bacterium]
MRILLVNSPTYGAHLKSAPLGLLYIISNCRREGREFDLIDGGLFKSPWEMDREMAARRFDVLGISAMTHNFPEALRIASRARLANPDAVIVIGGVHASTAPEESAVQAPGCLVMAGEGEEAFDRFLKSLEDARSPEDVPGLVRGGEGGFGPNPVSIVEDVDSLAFPAHEMVEFPKYTTGAHGLYFRRRPFATMITSRGCPFHCSFCAKTSLTGDTWRARSPENVLDEIELLTKRHGIREIHFEDDNIALNEERLVEICEGLLRRGIDITWKCPHGIYASHLTNDTFALMARSGCYSLSFGVESGNDEILARAGKKSSSAETARAIRSASRAGIQCVGFFILGLEGETEETIRQTISFAKSLPLDAAQFNLCVPFIGTPIRQTYARLGYLAEADLSDFDVDHAVINLPGLPARTLKRWRLRAFLQFYGRPGVFFRNLKNLSSVEVLRALFYRLRNVWRA